MFSIFMTADIIKVSISIIILTRNRVKEIVRTLQSCIDCNLPFKTEFIIVDNASTDGTQDVVESLLLKNQYQYSYKHLESNLGAAAGRNIGINMAHGRYLYFIDDDAYISEPKDKFFKDMVQFLVTHEDYFCVTTSIFDTKFNCHRYRVSAKKRNKDSIPKVLWFHGGSYLIDRQKVASKNLFLDYQFWGMEELYPSLKNYFRKKYIAEFADAIVIHNPSAYTDINESLKIIYHSIGLLHIKLIFFPIYTHPILYISFCLRIIRHLGITNLPNAIEQLNNINKNLEKETISTSQLVDLVRDFGLIETLK